jgi:hypothetical protein
VEEIKMKTLIIISSFLIAGFITNIRAQDTSRIKPKEKNETKVKTETKGDTSFQSGQKTKEQLQEKERKNIGNKSGQPFGKMKRKKDVFIDKDGDGICDPRVNGMGFDHLRKRHRTHQGGSGDGRGNGGSGGN